MNYHGGLLSSSSGGSDFSLSGTVTGLPNNTWIFKVAEMDYDWGGLRH